MSRLCQFQKRFTRLASDGAAEAIKNPLARVFFGNGGLRRNGRDGEIRTHDPLPPRQMRYQAALRPDMAGIILQRRSRIRTSSSSWRTWRIIWADIVVSWRPVSPSRRWRAPLMV